MTPRALRPLVFPALACLALAAAATLGACRRTGPDGQERPDWRVIQLYGGAGSVQAITQPSSVEAFRIDPAPRAPEPGVAYCGVHRVTAGPFALSAEDGATLAGVLRDPDTYDWRRAKSDPFRPTIGLRFTRDVSRVDLALDMDSRMLTVHRQGRRIGVEDFDAAAPTLRALLERVLPPSTD